MFWFSIEFSKPDKNRLKSNSTCVCTGISKFSVSNGFKMWEILNSSKDRWTVMHCCLLIGSPSNQCPLNILHLSEQISCIGNSWILYGQVDLMFSLFGIVTFSLELQMGKHFISSGTSVTYRFFLVYLYNVELQTSKYLV